MDDRRGDDRLLQLDRPPPAVTTAAASSVTTWPVPNRPGRGDRAGRRRRRRPRRRRRCPAAAPPPPAPPTPSRLAMTPMGPSVGSQSGELPADPAHLGAERRHSRAIAHVAPRQAAGPHPAVVGDDQLLTDLRAGGVARLAGLSQADARPYQQRLDRRHRDAERLGDVGVGHAAQLAHQQRRALLIGQARTSAIRRRRASRCSMRACGSGVRVSAARSSIGAGSSASCGRRISSTQRLWATRYSHARSASSRRCCAARSRRGRRPPAGILGIVREPASICRV